MDKEEKEIIKSLIDRFTSEDYDPEALPLFQEWISNRANEQVKDEALLDVWNVTPYRGKRRHANNVLRRIKVRAGMDAGGKKLRLSSWRVAAMIALPLLVLTGVWIFVGENIQPTPTVAEEIMGTTLEEGSFHILLDDGSEVWRAEAATLTVEQERNTVLVGDALYSVKREYVGERQFTVHTRHLTATVLGTVFRVTALPDADETLITLYEGSLEVTAGEFRETINSGTRFVYDNRSGEYSIEPIDLPWPEQVERRTYVYDSRNIAAVLEEIGQLYGVRIDRTGYSGAGDAVTLKFHSGTNLENVMYMLSGISGNFDYRITDDRIYIYDK